MDELQQSYMGVLIAADMMQTMQKTIDKIFYPPDGDAWDYDTRPSPLLAGRKECRTLDAEQQAAILFDPHRLVNHADMTLQAQYYNLYRNAPCFAYDKVLLDRHKYRPNMSHASIKKHILKEVFVSEKDPVTNRENRKPNTQSLKHYHAMYYCLDHILAAARETGEFGAIANDFSNQQAAIAGFVMIEKLFLKEGLAHLFGLNLKETTLGSEAYWKQNELKPLFSS